MKLGVNATVRRLETNARGMTTSALGNNEAIRKCAAFRSPYLLG